MVFFNVCMFLLWTLMLYWIHRTVHLVPGLRELHWEHHLFANQHGTKWHWSNLFFFTDTWKCAIDLWVTEVIPTLLFSYVTGCWWIFVFYYVWAAFFQENLEHNTNIDVPLLTFGKWHMAHHRRPAKHFGLFIPLWDVVFKTTMVYNK